MKPTESRKRYNDYPAYFKELFGERVQKLSIDGGFTCPNRDGKKGTGGCTFCNNESFNPGYCRAVSGISRQIGEGRAFFARKFAPVLSTGQGRGPPAHGQQKGKGP